MFLKHLPGKLSSEGATGLLTYRSQLMIYIVIGTQCATNPSSLLLELSEE